MLERKAIRIPLLFTAEQAALAERIAGCCRAVSNAALDQRRWFYRTAKAHGKPLSYSSQAGELSLLKAEFEWLSEAPHHCLQQALVDLDRAYQNFWSGRTGSPKPRKRGVDDSFRFPDPTQLRLTGNLRMADKRRTRSIKHATLHLPKLGQVKCVLHRSIAEDAKLLSITVSREAGRWYASVLTEQVVNTPVDRSAEPVVGIDLGVAQPVMLSNGVKYDLPRATKGDMAHLARLQRRVSSKVKGSRNRRKAVLRLAAFKAAQARRRRDAMEKVTSEIAKNHGVVAMENLKVANMTSSAKGTVDEPGVNVAAKAGLNRSILDVAPGALRLRLGQKLAASGGMLLLVHAAYTSQRCNACGHTDAQNRPCRDLFRCISCGHEADADLNAAANIRDRAKGQASGPWGQAQVEIAASTEMLLKAQAKPKRSFRKKKQESGTGGLPGDRQDQACPKRGGFLHGQGRKHGAVTRPGASVKPAPRSPVL